MKRRTGGRSARVLAAVLKATLQAVAERGADAISISEIARQAEVQLLTDLGKANKHSRRHSSGTMGHAHS